MGLESQARKVSKMDTQEIGGVLNEGGRELAHQRQQHTGEYNGASPRVVRVRARDTARRRRESESITHPRTVEYLVRDTLRVFQEAQGHGGELAQYAPRLIDMSRDIVPAEMRRGVVKLPKGARDTDVVSMVVVPAKTKIELERGFSEPTPTQIAYMLETIHEWEPIKGSDEEMLSKLFGYSRRERRSVTLRSLGLVANSISSVLIKDSDFRHVKGGNVAIIGGRPLVVIQYGALASPVVLAHELAHVNQLNVRTLTLNNERNEDMMSMEFEAYHISALTGRAMQAAGHQLMQQDLRQIEIDDIRLRHAAGPQDYRPTQAMLNDLRNVGLLQHVAHSTVIFP